MRKTALFFLLPAALFGAYPYYSINQQGVPAYWTANGDPTFASANGGSQISSVAVPDGTNEYEVRTTLSIKASGGTFITYLRASADALSGPNAAGTYYAVELQDVVVSGGTCSATLVVYKRVGNYVYWLDQSPAPCKDGMTWRIARAAGAMWIGSDLGSVAYVPDSEIATGKPGFGARDLNTAAGNGFASVSLGPADRTAPTTITQQMVASSVAANRIDLQWQGVADDMYTAGDHNGSGLHFYQLYRDNEWITNLRQSTYSDTTVHPNEPHTYTLVAVDYHGSYSYSSPIAVHTPSSGGIDPRRTGVRSNGTYWGGNGEQIDLLSGNLNFTLPLVRAQGRGGWGVTFALNYNSANFRKDTAATWKLGRDSGYGFGWKFLAGSLTAYYSNWFTVDHYLFTDSTGAEYRLNQQSNGIWYSNEGIYVRYDPAKNQLYFPDGSFWEFGAISSGAEEDAGTMYPTKMQDTNGNLLGITYATGL